MKELTLRQVEVIRAVMMTGTINGAAALLNVSSPGISRLVKHTEESLGIRLFERKAGVFIPSIEASPIFDQMANVHQGIRNLNQAVEALSKGKDTNLSFASAPSVAQFIAARALQKVRTIYPQLFIDLNILKHEETADYLLLERGEFVVMSNMIDNPVISNELIGEGRVVCIVPDSHPLAKKKTVSSKELAHEQLIGVDRHDPYGALIHQAFEQHNITMHQAIKGRYAQTVVSLVRHGLGVALIDEFSVAEIYLPGVTRLTLEEEVFIRIYVCKKKGRVLSAPAEYAVTKFKEELKKAVTNRPWEQKLT